MGLKTGRTELLQRVRAVCASSPLTHDRCCCCRCRLERWLQAALARPSAQQTKPTDEVIIASWAKFVSPLQD